MKILNFLRFIGNIFLIYFAFVFLIWYIKGHFNKKWFWIFWLNTIVAIMMCFVYNKPDPERERIDRMTGAEYWKMTH